ncbi:hypothetical protein RCO48_34225 [Peribacillus frigoritolerans]|nr:hypothetical protein [Peribacillus frigoritolerans]
MESKEFIRRYPDPKKRKNQLNCHDEKKGKKYYIMLRSLVKKDYPIFLKTGHRKI